MTRSPAERSRVASAARRVPGRLPVWFDEGIELWLEDDVAALLPEVSGRVAVLRADGALGHRPDDVTAGPWGVMQHGLRVHPRYLRAHSVPGKPAGHVWLPGGWTASWPMPRVAEDGEDPEKQGERALDGSDGTGNEVTQEQVLGGSGVLASEVWWLEERRGRGIWITAHGEVDSRSRAERAALWHPALVRLGRTWIHPAAVTAVRAHKAGWRVSFGPGSALLVASAATLPLARALGLAALDRFDPTPPHLAAMYREGLRDFPASLATASSAYLKRMFAGQPRRLAANLLWQRARCAEQPAHASLSAWRDSVLLPLLPAVEQDGACLPWQASVQGQRELLSLVRGLVLEARLVTLDELRLGVDSGDLEGFG